MSELLDIITEAVKRDEKTKPYDTTGKVTRIDGGTAWVHIDGGVDETPVRMTINASEGDVVQVRVGGGDAFLVGNGTAPPTDDRTANYALGTANTAQQYAQRAFVAAESAEADAARANEAANRAEAEAVRAYNEAERATGYANDALTQLSTVEDVVDTLNWITEHGTMTLTTDTAIDPTHVYFVVDPNGDYIVNNTHYSIVTEPDVSQLSTYYVLTIDEAVSNYVASHLALTDDGLYVVKDNQGYKVLLANDGLKVYDAGGHLVATFGENITFDAERPQKIGNNSTYVKFYDSNNDYVADKIEISGDVNITNTVTIGGSPQSDYLNSNVQVGGRNLLQHTDDYADWTLSGVTQTDSTPTDILNYTQISSDANAAAVCTYRFPYSYIRNKTITFSCFAKAAANTNMEMFWEIDLHADTTSSRLKYTTPSMDFTAIGDWQKVSRTVDVKDSIFTLGTGSPNYETCYARILLHRLPACHYAVQVKELMCEVGNVASDWSLATEDLQNSISAAQSTANSANYQEQTIYKQAVSGTNSMSDTTTWVTATGESVSADTAGLTPVWTTKRPTYRSKYPVLFVATQRKTVGGTVTCTTPLKDDTVTVIDGGHITTGTIDASKATITNIDATKITVNKIQASQISTDTITVGSLSDGSSYSTTTQMNSAIGNAIDNIQVGGRNLLQKTKDYADWTTSGNITFTDNTPTKIASFPAVTSMSTYQPLIDTYKINYSQIRNQHCVLSMGVKVASNTTVSIMWQYEVYAVNGTTRLKYGNTSKTVTGTGNWSKLTFDLDVSDSIFTQGTGSPDYTNCEIRMSVWRNPSESYMSAFQLKELKLEIGDKETDWSPAPDDIDVHRYVTDIGSDGIRVHDANTVNNSLVIDSNGVEIFKGGTGKANSVAFYGDYARVGAVGGYSTNISAGSVSMVGSQSEQLWSVQSSGTTQVNSSTITQFGVQTSTTRTGTKEVAVDISSWSTARTVTIKCTDTTSGTSSATRSISNDNTAISSANFFSGKAIVTFTKSGNVLKIGITINASAGSTDIYITQSVSSELPKMNFYGNNNVLWEASAVTYLTSSDTITLSEPISAQPSGIALLWGYNGTKNSVNVQFIPKYCVINSGFSGFPSGEISSATRNYPGYKQVYISSDTVLTGTDNNSVDGTSSFDSLHYYNSKWGLIAVLGV